MSYDPILALISIIFGILVIAFKDLLNWIVGIFFILLGIWLLLDYFSKSERRTGQTSPPPSPPQQGPPAQPPVQPPENK